MGLSTRVRDLWLQVRGWGRIRKARRAQAENPLREFLYLDETSVLSLYASRFGPVPHEFTDTEQRTTQADLGGEVGLTGTPTLKASPKLARTRSVSSQVLRKASLQATFKEWWKFESINLAFQSNPDLLIADPPTRTEEILGSIGSDPRRERALWPRRLERGAIVELEVELQAAEIYRLSTGFSSLLEASENSPGLLGPLGKEAERVASFARVIEHFLANLVPVQAKIVNYTAIDVDGQPAVVHESLTRSLASASNFFSVPTYLVGVTEEDLYWKDIRRVLFAKSRVRVLARVVEPELRTEWNPVKLTDLLREISPAMADSIETGLRDTVRAMRALEGQPVTAPDGPVTRARSAALVHYGTSLIQACGQVLEGVAPLHGRANELVAQFDRPDGQYWAFAGIEEFVRGQYDCEPDPALNSDLRKAAREANGLGPDGSLLRTTAVVPTLAYSQPDLCRYLEVEIIGIYR
jgi:hypothetical protein